MNKEFSQNDEMCNEFDQKDDIRNEESELKSNKRLEKADDFYYINNLDLDITEEEKEEIRHINVLYLDDDIDVLDSYKSMHRMDFNIFTTTDPMEARHIIATEEIHIIITDQKMPLMTGLQFFTMIYHEYPEPIRVLLTGYANLNKVAEALRSNIIYKHIAKPFTPNKMRQAIKNATEMYYLRCEIREAKDPLAETNY